MGCNNALVRRLSPFYHCCGHEAILFVAPFLLPLRLPILQHASVRSRITVESVSRFPWFEFVYRQPWAAQSSGNVLWETMVALPNQTPLFQIKHSIHAASLVGLSKQAFTDASNTLQGLLPNVDLGMFGCLNPGVWIDDQVISLFIDCLRRGMPEPSSPESREVHPPSMLRSSKAIQLDFAEVCILDSQHARLIRQASDDGDWRKVLRILAGFCKFNTV